MNPQPTQGDKKDTINLNVELENVESNVHDSAALATDAQEDEVRAEHLLFATFQGMDSFIAHERETLRQLEERGAELIKDMENVRLQMESILEQTEADQAKLDEEIEEIINMNINSPDNLTGFSERALDGNFNEELPKKSGQESSIVTITEPDMNERHDEQIDEPQPDANNMIDNNVDGAEIENEVAIDIKQDTQEKLEADNQQFAAKEKLLESVSADFNQEEEEELGDQLHYMEFMPGWFELPNCERKLQIPRSKSEGISTLDRSKVCDQAGSPASTLKLLSAFVKSTVKGDEIDTVDPNEKQPTLEIPIKDATLPQHADDDFKHDGTGAADKNC